MSKADVCFFNSIYPLLSFQSNLAFVKNPPSEYMASSGRFGLDILGGLNNMKKKLKNGQYKSQYEFTVELEQLVSVLPFFDQTRHFRLCTLTQDQG